MDDLNRQLGETMVELKYIREQVDRVAASVEKQQADLESVKLELAEMRGAKKLVEWIRSIIAGVIGAVAGIASLLGVFWGMK